MEFEIRESDFINKGANKNHLPASTINLKIDRNSVLDLLMAGDLTKDA